MFTCQTCGKEFDLAQAVLDRYPGWTPKQCMDCRNGKSGSGQMTPSAKPTPSVSKARDMTTAEVLATFRDGPQTGVFTDGASRLLRFRRRPGEARLPANGIASASRGSGAGAAHWASDRAVLLIPSMLQRWRILDLVPGESLVAATVAEG